MSSLSSTSVMLVIATTLFPTTSANNFTCAKACAFQMCNETDTVGSYSCQRGCGVGVKIAKWPDDIDEYCHSAPVGKETDFGVCKQAAQYARGCLMAQLDNKSIFECRLDASKPPSVLYVSSTSTAPTKVNSFLNTSGIVMGKLTRKTCVEEWGNAYMGTPVGGLFLLDQDAEFVLFSFKFSGSKPSKELDGQPFPLAYALTSK